MNLPGVPTYSRALGAKLDTVIRQTAGGPPADLADIAREELGVDLATQYGGMRIPHPFGKASGQLSCTVAQVDDDVRAGLAFVVLKTVIAEDATGGRSMEAWTVRDTKMRVEERVASSGRTGWTVTWTGRGWHGTLGEYLAFFEAALAAAIESDVPVIPSVKFHLPAGGEPFRVAEYEHTTAQLLGVWTRVGCGGAMVLEKDFSPTLAGDARAADLEGVLRWLENVPGLVDAAVPDGVRLGIKVMNAVADDDSQLAMLHTLSHRAPPRPAFLVVFNRLFDRRRGVAFGGWDLSDRNLRVLRAARERGMALPPLSATGNICSGRVMLEYALLGCENGQVHTFFQLPHGAYTASAGTRSARALHTLLLHPAEGLVPWLWHLHEAGHLEPSGGVLRFRDVIGRIDE
ncbi:MAG: hypothetical protein O7I93_08320 [Gemmatimonadetes bacterium]|nr:hypothetical protein [Gemmatimonadota bacterium]